MTAWVDEPLPLQRQRVCGWCDGPIPAGARSDSKYCGTPCRQAAHRFGKGRALRPATGEPMRFGYADPPYVGKARLYLTHADYAGEVDHASLLERMTDLFPDGWALSCSAESLQELLVLCPTSVRVAAWLRGERPSTHRRPLVTWEAVIYNGGRALLFARRRPTT